MLTFCTQWRFIPSKRRYQLYSTIKLVRYYPNNQTSVTRSRNAYAHLLLPPPASGPRICVH